MMTRRKRQRGGCLGRMVGVAAAAALVAVPVGLALPDDLVGRVLATVYPGGGWDLGDPQLVESWRWIIGGAAGLLAALALVVLSAVARRRSRRAVRRDTVEAQLAKAVRGGDLETVRACAEQLSVTAGAEAVPVLMAALEAPLDDETRRALAAALYRLGRAVTAEISPRPRRV
ncbi:MAG: hypothetical protein HZB16_09080 [Armatimonadetes bacterium]|nr:hypothetical protein [Armatimonadota bacterium]